MNRLAPSRLSLASGLLFVVLTVAAAAAPQDAEPASVMSQAVQKQVKDAAESVEKTSAGAAVSMFAIDRPRPREFQRHDLITIVVRETTRVSKKNEVESEKEWELDGGVARFPDLSLSDLLNLQAFAGRTTDLPQVDINLDRSFAAEGEKKHQEDFTTRLQAEVIEMLPNGNLVLEARTMIIVDSEETTMRVTGVCRPEDVTPANTVLSTQIHDLVIERDTQGELRRTTEKGILARVFEAIFSF